MALSLLSNEPCAFYRLKDRYKKRTKCSISISISAKTFKLCQIYMHKKWLHRWCPRLVMWPGCNFYTSLKMRARLHISDSTSANNFKLCQMYRHNKRLTMMASSNWSRDLDTIYRPVTKWGPDYISLVLEVLGSWNFVRCICITREQETNTDEIIKWSRDLGTIYRPAPK